MKRAVIVMLDSVGIGELPDASAYGDTGSHTLGNIAKTVSSFSLPNLEKLGLGKIAEIRGIRSDILATGVYGKMAEMSKGKDTTTGHWEMAGVILHDPFPTYPHGFPPEVLEAFESAVGVKTIGNTVASGTAIIAELGDEHVKTGSPIVYTSADSVFQIAAHEDVVPLEKLYEMCRTARRLLTGKHAVGRVIARPFKGTSGAYQRTTNRHDFSLEPTGVTVLELAERAGLQVRAVGKIEDIYAGKGITHAVHTKSNDDGMNRTIEWMKEDFSGILFTNLVDFDMLFGHRNDPEGYAAALMAFDKRLPEIISALREDDILFITADHGCDPTTPSTDHSREYVPVIVTGNKIIENTSIGTRRSFADLGATISEYLGIDPPAHGQSFLKEIVMSKI